MSIRNKPRMFEVPKVSLPSISIPSISLPRIPFPSFRTITIPTITLPMVLWPKIPSAFLDYSLLAFIFAIACFVVTMIWKYGPRKEECRFEDVDIEGGEFVLKRTGSSSLKDMVFLRRRSSVENGAQHILPY